MSGRRVGSLFLFSLFAILFGLWLALGGFKKTIVFDPHNIRALVSSLLDTALFTKIHMALAEGQTIGYYLSDPSLLIFAGIAFLAAFAAGVAIWRITAMAWKAAKMNLEDLRRPRAEEKPRSKT
jgi:hypothetical protein